MSKRKHKNEPKNQHIVNQAYLQKFATPESIAQHRSEPKRWHVRVYDKLLGRVLPSRPIRNVAAEQFFYNRRGEPATLEEQLGSLEGPSAEIHRKLLKTKNYTELLAFEKETFAKFIAIQYARTNQQRLLGEWISDKQLLPVLLDPVKGVKCVEQFVKRDIARRYEQVTKLEREISLAYLKPIPVWQRNEVIESLKKQIETLNSQNYSTKDELDPANLEKARRGMVAMLQQDDPDYRRDVHVFQMMSLAPALSDHIQSRVWQISENKTDTPLCTSDHPVLTIPVNPPQHEDLNHAFLSLGIPDMGDAIGLGRKPDRYPPFQLAFPLSPNLMLSLYPYGSTVDPYRLLSENEAKMLNKLQTIQSSRQIYSRDADFAFVVDAWAYYKEMQAYVENIAEHLAGFHENFIKPNI